MTVASDSSQGLSDCFWHVICACIWGRETQKNEGVKKKKRKEIHTFVRKIGNKMSFRSFYFENAFYLYLLTSIIIQ